MPKHNTTDVQVLGERYGACSEAIAWAKSECKNAAEIWNKADDGMLAWIALRQDVLTNDELRDLARWCLSELDVDPARRPRITSALDGTDHLAYPSSCSRERWAACSAVNHVRGDRAARNARIGQYLRKLENPFHRDE